MNLSDQYLIFMLDEKRYAIGLSSVEKVIRAVEMNMLPEGQDLLLGLINMQGRIIPVINIRKYLYLQSHEMDINDRIIISRAFELTVAFIVDAGYSKMVAASLVGLVGLLGSAGGILSGILSDHFSSKTGYTLGSVLSFTGIFFLLLIKNSVSTWMLYTFVILHGFGTGGKIPMTATITYNLFPGNALGRILAIQSIGFGFGGAIGAYLGGYFYDQMGTYFIPFSLLLASIILGVASIWMAAPNRLRISRNASMQRDS